MFAAVRTTFDCPLIRLITVSTLVPLGTSIVPVELSYVGVVVPPPVVSVVVLPAAVTFTVMLLLAVPSVYPSAVAVATTPTVYASALTVEATTSLLSEIEKPVTSSLNFHVTVASADVGVTVASRSADSPALIVSVSAVLIVTVNAVAVVSGETVIV